MDAYCQDNLDDGPAGPQQQGSAEAEAAAAAEAEAEAEAEAAAGSSPQQLSLNELRQVISESRRRDKGQSTHKNALFALKQFAYLCVCLSFW